MKILKNSIAIFSLILAFAAAVSAQTAKGKPAAKPETKPAATAAAPKADEIIDKFVAATGGYAAYKKPTSYYTKGSMEVPAAGIKVTFEGFHKAPNKTAVFMKIPGVGEMTEIFDGTKAWSSDPFHGAREKTGEELLQTKIDADFYRFARLKEIFTKRELKGVEKVGGADAYAVVMSVGGVSHTYYFDAKTNLLVRVDQIAVTPEGKTPAQIHLSDYRNVEGVLMPFTLRLETPAAGFTMKTEEVKANVAIDDAKFAQPAK